MTKKTNESNRLWKVEVVPKGHSSATGFKTFGKKLEDTLNQLESDNYSVIANGFWDEPRGQVIVARRREALMEMQLPKDLPPPEPHWMILGLLAPRTNELFTTVLRSINPDASESERLAAAQSVVNDLLAGVAAEEIRAMIDDCDRVIKSHRHEMHADKDDKECPLFKTLGCLRKVLEEKLRIQLQ